MTITRKPTWEEPLMAEPQTRVRIVSLSRLRKVMKYRGFTSGYQLAKAAGLTPGVVNFLVHGHRSTCSAETARAIEEVLDQDPGRLFVLEMSEVDDDRARAV